MTPQSEREIFLGSELRGRIDGDQARHILEKAAAEQYRRRKALDDTYSLEELQEMAAEAGISQEALRSVIRSSATPARTSRRWLPQNWFRTNSGLVLAGVAAMALVALIIAFPAVAYVIVWTTIILGVLILLGASPF